MSFSNNFFRRKGTEVEFHVVIFMSYANNIRKSANYPSNNDYWTVRVLAERLLVYYVIIGWTQLYLNIGLKYGLLNVFNH